MDLIQHIPDRPSKIALIGEAPGKNEMEQGQPFVGYEGRKLLTPLLSKAGINRDQIYISNTVHEQPPKNDYSQLPLKAKEDGKEQLKKDLEKWKSEGLNLVIACGKQALETLTDKKGIYAYRGTVMPCDLVPGLKVFATLHPGVLIKGQGKYAPIIKLDLENAFLEKDDRTIHYPERNIEIVDNVKEAKLLLKDFTDYKDIIACDIETAGKLMIAYGIATSEKQAYVFTKDILLDYDCLRQLSKMAYSSTPKMFHNALFDCFHNSFYYKILNNNIAYDTMIAQHSVYPTLPKSLAFCSSIYTVEPYWKSEGKEFFEELKKGRGDWNSLYEYNAKDCCLTYEIYEKLEEEIDRWNVRETFNRTMACIRPVLFAMQKGIKIDPKAVQDFADKNEKELQVLTDISSEVLGDINLNSPKQLSHLIYNVWDMPKQRKGGKLTIEDKKLAKLEALPTNKQAKLGLIRAYRSKRKLRDFYKLSLNEDGKIRCSLNPTGTYTGRWSSSKSITGSGQNLQNVPEDTRQFYIPEKGKILINADLSQSEARIVAALCKDLKWLKQFDGEDIHSLVAASLYDVDKDKVDKKKRFVGKKVSHATHYLLGKMLLSEIVGFTPKEAQQKKDKYFELRPKLKDWHKFITTTIKKEKIIRTCFGRVIQFFDPFFDQVVTDATAAEPQSTSADILNNGIISCYNEISDFEFLLQVHDSILCQVPDNLEAIKKVIFQMKDLVEIKINIRGVELVVPLDFKIGYDWKNMVEIDDLGKIDEYYGKLQ